MARSLPVTICFDNRGKGAHGSPMLKSPGAPKGRVFFSAGRPREYFRTYRHYDDADHVPRSGRYFFASAAPTFSVKFFSNLANMSVNALASMQVSQCESTGSAASKGRPRFW